MFWRKKERPLKENEVRIELPEDSYTLLEWREDDLPCIGMLNSGLKNFEHKNIFSWHLSVIIDFEELIDNGMPSIEEREIVDPFGDKLEEDIKAGGNALFLIRETWNATRRLVWRVYDPEIADQHLKYIVENQRYPRQFDWRMVQDPEWKEAQWYFDQLKT
jgi:hypothetical protein